MKNDFQFTETDLEKFCSEVRAVKDEDRKHNGVINVPVKISDCHDFSESHHLWAVEGRRLRLLVSCFSFFYLTVGYLVLAHFDGKKGIPGWYFLAATLSTVGYGDYAPVSQVSDLSIS